uniref:Uncharacterized protein n=1 Tax=Arundo donax TaxID=35708 RepID=A0A0A8YNS6_ARUDO
MIFALTEICLGSAMSILVTSFLVSQLVLMFFLVVFLLILSKVIWWCIFFLCNRYHTQ